MDHESGVFCQDVDETGSLLVTGTEEGQVVVWNVGSLYPIAEMRGKNSDYSDSKQLKKMRTVFLVSYDHAKFMCSCKIKTIGILH